MRFRLGALRSSRTGTASPSVAARSRGGNPPGSANVFSARRTGSDDSADDADHANDSRDDTHHTHDSAYHKDHHRIPQTIHVIQVILQMIQVTYTITGDHS